MNKTGFCRVLCDFPEIKLFEGDIVYLREAGIGGGIYVVFSVKNWALCDYIGRYSDTSALVLSLAPVKEERGEGKKASKPYVVFYHDFEDEEDVWDEFSSFENAKSYAKVTAKITDTDCVWIAEKTFMVKPEKTVKTALIKPIINPDPQF